MDTRSLNALVGKPFVDGARGPDSYDCWGLAMAAMLHFGYRLPDFNVAAFDAARIDSTISDQRSAWTELAQPEAGCVIIMRFGCRDHINHIAVALSDTHMLHTREKTGSVIERFTTPVFQALIKGFLRPPAEHRIP